MSMKTNPNITEPRALQWLLIGVALLFLLLMLVVPLAAVFFEALKGGWDLYVASLVDAEAKSAIRLTLITAAIVLWNTVYIERAVDALREQGQVIEDDHLQYLSPLGWEHINLTGDYVWNTQNNLGNGKFRPLSNMDEW